jgi:hypothetical protein
MSVTLLLLTFAIIAACVGLLLNEGIWSNAIRLINVVTAALLATNWYETVAGWLDGSYTYFVDFVALWFLFCLFMVIFRVATDFASRMKVRFLATADRIGGVLLATWIGWVMVCFTMMSLHTAPLPRNFLGFEPGKAAFFGLGPDRQWLAFTQRMSRGGFSRWTPTEFDARGEFIPKYASRRNALEAHVKKYNAFRVDPNAPK